MSVKSKLKNIAKSVKKAEVKLVDQVEKKAKKKKILKKVEEIQQLIKKKDKLEKKVKSKAKVTDRAPKKKEESKKPKSEESTAHKVEPNKKKAPEIISLSNGAPKGTVTSLSFNSKEAISKLPGLSSVSEVDAFTEGDTRVTVMSRAQSRKNAIQEELNEG